MDEYRESQREKWLRAQQAKEASGSGLASESGASSSAGPANNSANAPNNAASSTEPPAWSGSAAATSVEKTNDSRHVNIRRMHILPVGDTPENCDVSRLQFLAPELHRKRETKDIMRDGIFIRSLGQEFAVVKCEPDEGVLCLETDYYVDGDPLVRFEKVQFLCLKDFEMTNTNQDPTVLFSDYISPYFRNAADSGQDLGSIATLGERINIFGLEFQVSAVEPSHRETGIIDSNTMIFADWDPTPEFDKIHFVPFHNTLPHAYDFDIFNDYLKPYLTRHKNQEFRVNDQFTYQGVQFKVVCCEPNGPARIGRDSNIYCEGVLHPSLRDLLPPELLEQFSHLPPVLQMALAGGLEERQMGVQEMHSRRHGLTHETIDRVPKFTWEEGGREHTQTQCMVCLSNFAPGEEVRQLPCGHIFHASCVDEWLRRCTACPLCKANVDRAVRQY